MPCTHTHIKNRCKIIPAYCLNSNLSSVVSCENMVELLNLLPQFHLL